MPGCWKISLLNLISAQIIYPEVVWMLAAFGYLKGLDIPIAWEAYTARIFVYRACKDARFEMRSCSAWIFVPTLAHAPRRSQGYSILTYCVLTRHKGNTKHWS